LAASNARLGKSSAPWHALPARVHRQDADATIKSRFFLGRAVLNSELAMSSKPKQPGTELNFEKAMDRLEAIVEQMESGKLPLEDLIVRYEEGMNLVKICQERLASAEQKIEIIARNSAGKPIVKDFEPAVDANIDKLPAEEGEKQNDEVRLF
jgi:exodeoxyribonuclease VII small subunit